MLVGLLTLIEKEAIEGKMYQQDLYYNPVQDINDNWIISTEEINGTTNPDYLWVKTLPLITYEPKQDPFDQLMFSDEV
jgi:hypothetical protein